MKKKEITVVSYGGSDAELVWLSPVKDFGINTELTVPFSHEAILVQDGQVLETFQPGKYILNEDTTPFFGTLFSEQKTAKNSEVYYVNKEMSLVIPWGTPTQLELFDSMLKMPVRVGASGELEISVINSRKVLLKLSGCANAYTTAELSDFFRSKISLYLKDALAEAMIENKISYYEIAVHLKELSKSATHELEPVFLEYGVKLNSFSINNVSIPSEIKSALEKAYLDRAKREIAGGEGPAFCGKCGANVREGDVFCGKCGAKR